MARKAAAEQPRLLREEQAAYQVDDQEKAAYRERLRQKLQDPAFRQIEGFPIGTDEAILALSDPPYYTACPNPFLPEIIERWQQERAGLRQRLGLPDDSHDNGHPTPTPNPQPPTPIYHREPFAADVSEGKNDPIYNAHSYHTKVPHKAIMRYILHYTDPGDIVFDGFCGTGMTGVAAQLCGDRQAVASLGYRVDAKGVIYDGDEAISRLGARKAVLNDLSPAATFIAYNYNTPVDAAAFEREARRILREVEEECGWMYETWHPSYDSPNRVKGKINFVLWSDVFVCSQCSNELIFWNEAVDTDAGKVMSEFACPYCRYSLSKDNMERAWHTFYDEVLAETVVQAKQKPVVINYSIGRKRFEKTLDREDNAMIDRIASQRMLAWTPLYRMPEGDESRRNDRSGITHLHHFYTLRNWQALAVCWKFVNEVSDFRLRNALRLVCTAIMPNSSKMRRFRADRKGGGPLPGTLYMASLFTPLNVIDSFERNSARIKEALRTTRTIANSCTVTTQSATSGLDVVIEQVDYIFVDPPFGSNLMYSELNSVWEPWFSVLTNNRLEAIINGTQGKGLQEYQRLMEQSFRLCYQVLKPGRWITVEFHNSQNNVWGAIQEALLRAGFVVADVRTLDKKQGTFKQTNISSAVKQDLVISAYKPRSSFEQRFLEQAGTAGGAWAFVRQHLAQLPIVVEKDGVIETLSERQDYLLYDRMVAFHIQRGATVPLSAAEFYAGLRQRFIERDGMFFLPEQTPEYDRARLQAQQVAQLALFVSDEKSAIQWLRQQLNPALGGRPQSYQDLQPQFLRQLHQARHEALPELAAILEQNFLEDERGRWYAPDPNQATDLEQLRQKALLREFAQYTEGQKRLRLFRTEAMRAGFAHAWRNKDYATILQVGNRLPENVLQEDPELLMYYDNAGLRV